MTRTIGILFPAKVIKDRATEASKAGFQPFGMQCSEIESVEHTIPSCDTLIVPSLAAVEACHAEMTGKVWSDDETVKGVMTHLGLDVVDSPSGKLACLRSSQDSPLDGAEDVVVCNCPPVLKGSALLHVMIGLKRGEVDTLVFNNAESAHLLVESLDEKYGVDDSRYYLEEHVRIATVGPTALAYVKHLGLEPEFVLDDQPLTEILKKI